MKQIMDEASIVRTVKRITHEIIERNKGVKNIVLVGIETRGALIAKIIQENILQIEAVEVPCFSFNVSYWRDDLEKEVKKPEEVYDFKGKIVILIDDVLYKGRTVRAAMDGVISYGRPTQIQFAVLIDRGHRELPIRADYVGKNIPTSQNERVSLRLKPLDNSTEILIEK